MVEKSFLSSEERTFSTAPLSLIIADISDLPEIKTELIYLFRIIKMIIPTPMPMRKSKPCCRIVSLEMMEVLRRKMVMQTAITSIKKSPTLAVLKGITVC